MCFEVVGTHLHQIMFIVILLTIAQQQQRYSYTYSTGDITKAMPGYNNVVRAMDGTRVT